MKLTKLAQSIKDTLDNDGELNQEQEKLAYCSGSEGFDYGIAEGYIKLEEWIDQEDLSEAQKILTDYKKLTKLIEPLLGEM